MLTKSDILNGLLQNISLDDEPVVMVHSSYKSLRGVAEGPDGLIDALLDFVGKNGTLLIPTFNFTSWSNEHYYDIVETPSEMGVVTELARKRQGFARTPHPIYSFTVYGKHQEAYLKAPSPSIMGQDSVFSLFHQHNGLILSIGLDYNHSFTFVHHVELSAEAKHRRIKEFGGLYLDQNRELSLRKYQMYVRSTKKMSTYVNPAMEILATEGIIKNFNMGSARLDYAFAKEYYPRCFELVTTDPKLFYK